MPRRTKRVINVPVIAGEPKDGSGRVCIHLFVRDDRGSFVEPHVLHPVVENGVEVKQRVRAKATRGRLACDVRKQVAPATRDGVITVTPRTDDPRSVTCPKCLASEYHQKAMEVIKTFEGK